MRKSRYSDEQIAAALRQAEIGTPVAEITRKLRQLRDENAVAGLSAVHGRQQPRRRVAPGSLERSGHRQGRSAGKQRRGLDRSTAR